MSKASMVEELKEYQITPHPSWGINEVREMLKEQRAARTGDVEAPKGLSKMTLDQLVAEAKRCNIMLPERPTKGVLAKMIRDHKVAPNDTIVGFGRYKGWAYAQLPGDYLEWVLTEWKTAESCSDDLARLARWWEEQKKTKGPPPRTRTARGRPRDDGYRATAGLSRRTEQRKPQRQQPRVSPAGSPSRCSLSPRRARPDKNTKNSIQRELAELKARMEHLAAMAQKLEDEDTNKKAKESHPRAFLLGTACRDRILKQARQLKRHLATERAVYDSSSASKAAKREEQPEHTTSHANIYVVGGHPSLQEALQEGEGEELPRTEPAQWSKKAAESVFEKVALERPQVLWIHLPEGVWERKPGAGPKHARRGNKEHRSILQVVLEAMEQQAVDQRAVVITHPTDSELWKAPGVLKWEAAWPHQVIYYKVKRPGHDTGIQMKAALTEDVRVQTASLREEGAQGDPLARAVKKGMEQSSTEAREVYTGGLQDYISAEPNTEPHLEEHGANSIRFDPRVPAAVQSTLRRMHCTRTWVTSGMRPASARPAKPVPLLDFNEVLGIDLIFLKDSVGATHVALSMVDYASTFHVVVPVKDRTAKTLAEVVRDHWVAWAGPPRSFALDLDSGFKGVFDEMCYEFGSFMSHAAGTAHWQHGLVERHNGAWKSIWERVVDSEMVADYEVAWAAAEVSNAKNQLRNKDGYSPRQWVFGVNPRLPGDVLDEPHNLSAMSHLTTDARMQRMNAVRQAARIAFLRVQTDQAMQRALLHRSRVKKTHYEPGDLAEEISELLRVRASMDDVAKTTDGEELEPTGGGPDMELDNDEAQEVLFGKVAATQASREKQMESEIPWTSSDRPAFLEAEAKQWEEHIQFGAVRVLSEQETQDVLKEVPAERILNSRFAYKDKARAQRLKDPTVPIRAKARLCIGGHRDPDLGVRALAVDAPTASKESLMLGMQCAVSEDWCASIGDVQAAFLNGVDPSGTLLSTAGERTARSAGGETHRNCERSLWIVYIPAAVAREAGFRDPPGGQTKGILETHVDDLLLLTERRLRKIVQAALSGIFPISEWEDDDFKYVGSNYAKTTEGYKITQTDYVHERLKLVDLPKGANQERVDERLFHDNRTAVGCLSWLAKEIKDTNRAIQQAKDFRESGITIAPIPLKEMSLVVFHDAAWANAEPQDASIEDLAGHKVGSQIGLLVLAVHRDCIGKRSGQVSVLAWKLVKEGEAAEIMPIHAVTDCKSFYDFVHRCGTPKPTADRRLIIDLASLKQIFHNEARGWWKRERGDDVPAVDDPLVIPFHWVPSGSQLSDVLTKQMKPDSWWAMMAQQFFLAVSHQRG
ncbi:HSP90 [Symbiodinium sp. CCMP2592]|nr:HSP90 [Symbiodinium sp. CCMP2592]